MYVIQCISTGNFFRKCDHFQKHSPKNWKNCDIKKARIYTQPSHILTSIGVIKGHKYEIKFDYCLKCDKEFQETGFKFCPKCGAKIISEYRKFHDKLELPEDTRIVNVVDYLNDKPF